jgi:hypothetical protein
MEQDLMSKWGPMINFSTKSSMMESTLYESRLSWFTIHL